MTRRSVSAWKKNKRKKETVSVRIDRSRALTQPYPTYDGGLGAAALTCARENASCPSSPAGFYEMTSRKTRKLRPSDRARWKRIETEAQRPRGVHVSDSRVKNSKTKRETKKKKKKSNVSRVFSRRAVHGGRRTRKQIARRHLITTLRRRRIRRGTGSVSFPRRNRRKSISDDRAESPCRARGTSAFGFRRAAAVLRNA